MSDYDVFNGDADGLCALQQLRLAEPRDALLVTGVKRDIALLQRVAAGEGDRVTVLDISLDKNRETLEELLSAGAEVEYIDHHFAGEIPQHAGLTARIDTSPETCTSLLVDERLGGAWRPWAVVGAFGDNFHEQAREVARPLGFSEEHLAALQQLGTCLNYNGYGVSLEDLLFHPADLFRTLHPYADPLAFIAEEPAYQTLLQGYRDDMAQADALQPELAEETCAVYILPDERWARRVSGVLGNALARRYPGRAHALLTPLFDGDFRVSVRAPLENRTGADELCRSFPDGGGRPAAAGINRLAAADYGRFIERLRSQYRHA